MKYRLLNKDAVATLYSLKRTKDKFFFRLIFVCFAYEQCQP